MILKNISLEKKRKEKKRKEKQKTSDESFKLGLIFHTRNSWNTMEDEITKKIKKFSNKRKLH
jgi:hypothetical protein